jgi:hypothetical protein
MTERLFWAAAGLLYGAAAIVLLTAGESVGSALCGWHFWALFGLGTAVATVGNALRAPSDEESDARATTGRGAAA